MQWKLKKNNPLNLARYRQRLGVSCIMASVLMNRKISLEDARLLMDDPGKLIEPPEEIFGCREAAEAIAGLKDSTRPVYIYADYDVDGITSGVLMDRFLKAIGCINVEITFPERDEGYGIDMEYAQSLDRELGGTVITVDNGITACEPLDFLHSAGFQTIVLDHHEPGEEAPDAIICDPWMDKRAGAHLCGCAVAWKTCLLAEEIIGINTGAEKLLPFAALGTIADVMPMLTENLAIVKAGLHMLNNDIDSYKGIGMIMEACEIDSLTAKDVAWSIAPKLNSCSRMGDTYAAARIFADDVTFDDVTEVLRYDKQRKELTDLAAKEAREHVADTDTPVIIFNGSKYPPGIAGVIAGKLSEEFGKPAIVTQGDEEIAPASCRSVPGVDIKNLIEYSASNGHAVGASGHAEACGAKMIASKEREFQKDAKKWMASNDIKPVEPVLPIDAELRLSEISSGLRNELSMLPYVKSAPKFSTHTVNIELMTPFKNKEHVVLKLNDDKGNTSYALKWHGMEAYRAAGSPRKGKVAGTLIPAKFAARSLGLHQDDTIIEIEDIQA